MNEGDKKHRFNKKTLIVLFAIVSLSGIGAGIYFVVIDDDSEIIGTAGRIEKTEAEELAYAELSEAEQYLQDGNTEAAIESALKAAEYAPDEQDVLVSAGSLIRDESPTAAKEIFGIALSSYEEQNNLDEDGKSASTYWAAADLAEQSGDFNKAIIYYEKAIDAVDPENEDEQFILNSSQAALERLQ